MKHEIDLANHWVLIEETETEIKVAVNPKKDGERALPLAYMLGSNMLIYTKSVKVKPKF